MNKDQPNERPPESTFSRILQGAVDRMHLEELWRNSQHPPAFLKPQEDGSMSGAAKVLLILIIVILLGIIGGGAYWFVWLPSQTGLIRDEIQAQLQENNYVEAYKWLNRLIVSEGKLTTADQNNYAIPIDKGLKKIHNGILASITAYKKDQAWDQALALIPDLKEAMFSEETALFIKCEILREAKREEQYMPCYAEYARLYPKTKRTDDALFWQAEVYKRRGDIVKLKRILQIILEQHLDTNFFTVTERWWDELQKQK